MSSKSTDLSHILVAKPTIDNAFRAWLEHAETTLSPKEFKSAKNFSRAFQIWYNKTNKPNATEHDTIGEVESISRLCVFTFVEDIELPDNPILERLKPSSKTTHVAKNCRHMVNFLLRLGLVQKEDLAMTVKECVLLEDFNRCRRALWVLYQHEIFFLRQLGGTTRPYQMSGKELDGVFRVTNISRNCVIVREHEKLESAPFKLQIPEVVACLLRAGDIIHAGIRKVVGTDYWVIVSPQRIDSFRAETVFYDYRPPQKPLEDSEYHKLAKVLLKVPIPRDGFPSAMYTEEWFTEREHDFTSDDEITGVWDNGPDLDLESD